VSVGLLDVNMLIALAWPNHVHHYEANAWFTVNQSKGWATCPLTQSAFIRVSSNPKIIPEAVTPREAIVLLKMIVSMKYHVFWPDDVSYSDVLVPTELLVGHRQVTDAYLLGLSIHHKGKLVTLDRGVAALLASDSAHLKALEIVSLYTRRERR
jgi:toxin-antitoxin system PIN domain toxin